MIKKKKKKNKQKRNEKKCRKTFRLRVNKTFHFTRHYDFFYFFGNVLRNKGVKRKREKKHYKSLHMYVLSRKRKKFLTYILPMYILLSCN